MIRKANIKDKEDIIRLGNLVNHNFSSVYDMDEYFSNDYNVIYLDIENGKIVGMIMAIILYESCEVLNIVVEDNFRRKGIASNLMDTLISEFPENIEILTLEVDVNNKNAIKLYQKFGLEIINTRKDYYENSDAYLMGVKYERC
mgnify:FL=1